MTMREQIAAVIVENRAVDNWGEPRPADYELADAIIAAMPGMVPDLVWVKFGEECVRAEGVLGRYEVIWGFQNGQYALDVPGHGRRTEWHPTIEAAKAAVNAHNRAAVCKALGL